MRLDRVLWLSTLLVSLTARAGEVTDTTALKATLEQNLLKPLAVRERERSRFSRAALPPQARRVRLPDTSLHQDARGQSYATFAVDVRYYDDKWSQSAMVGCIYPQDGSIYIKSGEGYRAAAMLLGKKSPNPPDSVCRTRNNT